MKRRIWLARVAFHNWMWKGGLKPRNPIRRAARHLPLYLSDPYYMRPERVTATLVSASNVFTNCSIDSTAASSTAITLRYNPPKEPR